MNSNIIQKYINNFRRLLSVYLKPNIGLQLHIYNCGTEGGMIVIYFKPGGRSNDIYESKYEKISDVLGDMKQTFFGGNLSGIHFKGTNTLMDPEKIILIKDSSPYEWSEEKLIDDINSIVSPPEKIEGGKR